MEKKEIIVKHKLIDPSAIGLFGLAMVTLVASSQKLGWTEGTTGILPWALFLGGAGQLVAAAYDAKENNVFGATAFFGFGFFWIGIGMTWLISGGFFGAAMATNFDPKQLGVAYIGYLIFSVFMTIGAAETHKVLFSIFVLIDVLFIGLAFSTLGFAVDFFHMVAAVAELLIALFSFYGSAAAVLNKHFGYVFLPVGKPLGIFKK